MRCKRAAASLKKLCYLSLTNPERQRGDDEIPRLRITSSRVILASPRWRSGLVEYCHEYQSMKHFIDLLDWDADQILKLLKDAARMKKATLKGKHKPHLQGKVLGMVFEKPSLRTRVSFQAGMAQLGGQAIFLNGLEVGLGNRESLPDIARTLCEFVDAIVLRTFQ